MQTPFFSRRSRAWLLVLASVSCASTRASRDEGQAACSLASLDSVAFSNLREEESGDYQGSELLLYRRDTGWVAWRRSGEGRIGEWNRAASATVRPADGYVDVSFPALDGNLPERLTGYADCRRARLGLEFGRASIEVTLVRVPWPVPAPRP